MLSLALKRKVNFFYISIVIYSIFLQVVFANPNNETERIRLDNKQAELTQKLNRLDEVSRRFTNFKYIRDNYFYGEKGIDSLGKSWFQDAISWIEKWHELALIVNRAVNFNDNDLQEAIRDKLNVQIKTWSELGKRSQEILNRENEATQLLKNLTLFGDNYIADYDPQIKSLNESIDRLKKYISVANACYDKNRQDIWNKLIVDTERITLIKLKKSMLNYPELKQTLEKVKQLFWAEKELYPIVLSAQKLYADFAEQVGERKVFLAEKSFISLNKYIESGLNSMAKANIDHSYFENYKESLINLKTAATNLKQRAISPYTKNYLVSENFRRSGVIFTRACRDEIKRSKVNCELFRIIFAIPIKEILKMNDPQLENLEQQIEKIKMGLIPFNI